MTTNRRCSTVPSPVPKLLLMLCFDMISIGLIVPLITPFIRNLGATPSEIGMISSVYGITQLISSPVLGRMSDRMSRRSIILLSLLGGACGYGILGIASSVKMVIVSRVVVGIFRQTMTVTKAWVTDVEQYDRNPDHTGAYLSWFYATASLGFMIGPAIGGKLAKSSEMGMRLPFLISTSLFVINAAAVFTFLPSGKVVQQDTLQIKNRSGANTNTWMTDIAALRPQVRGLMVIRFFIGISIMLARTGIFMLMEYKLNMDVVDKGYIMSLYAIGGLITQLAVVPLLLRRLTNAQLVTFSALSLMACQFLVAAVTSTRQFYVCIIGVATFSSVLKVAMSNALSVAAGKTSKGEVLGVAGSVMSICRAVAPMASGMLVEMYDSSAPVYIAACSMGVAALLGPMFVPKKTSSGSSSDGSVGESSTSEGKLKMLCNNNADQVKRLEKKMKRLTSSKKSRAVSQLNEVYENRAGSRDVARKLYETKIETKQETLRNSKSLKRKKTLWDGMLYWIRELRFPILVAIIYALYIRRGRLRN
jgi:MFS family permease